MIKAVKLEGSSMFPLFKPGQIVLVEAISHGSYAAGLRRGDCAVYSFEGRTLLHRVIAVDGSGLLISDDAGLIVPHKVPWSAVIGRVVTANPLKKGSCGFLYSRLLCMAKGMKRAHAR